MKLILLFPNRGDAPPDQPGYVREPGNPFVFRLAWVGCDLREDRNLCKSCPGSSIAHHCQLFGKEVDQNVCNNCPEATSKRPVGNHPSTEPTSDRVHMPYAELTLAEFSGMPTPDIGDEEEEQHSHLHENTTDVVVQELQSGNRSEDL